MRTRYFTIGLTCLVVRQLRSCQVIPGSENNVITEQTVCFQAQNMIKKCLIHKTCWEDMTYFDRSIRSVFCPEDDFNKFRTDHLKPIHSFLAKSND